MSEQQTYANHVYRARAWSITWLVAALAFLVLMFHVYEEPTYVSFAVEDFPSTGPTISRFTFSPTNPTINQDVSFNGSSSTGLEKFRS